MREGQDFGHRISLYQRYPTGFTGLQATRSLWVSPLCGVLPLGVDGGWAGGKGVAVVGVVGSGVV